MCYHYDMEIHELYKLISEGDISLCRDTRDIKPGDIYIALKGDTFDGNAYAQEALDKGARLAIIDNAAYKTDERCIVVEDTTTALQKLATLHRQTFSIPILVIGGSNGKTTTKELVAAVLAKKYTVHATKGNLNNERGLPLTLLAMPRTTEIAVIEIAADHAHEHTEKMGIVSPTHVLVTNNGADHLEGFGSMTGVRTANKEIFDCARTLQATAFVNKNIPELVADSDGLTRIFYPEHSYTSTSSLYAGIIYDTQPITSQLFGSLNEANILAAVAVGRHFEIPLEECAEAIKSYEPNLKRSQIIDQGDHTLILDCYNANPTSMTLALKDLFATTQPGTRIIIVGDMLEIGATEMEEHRNILTLINETKDAQDVVICIGPHFSAHKEAFQCNFFNSVEAAKGFYADISLSGKILFLKASRGVHLETLLL